MSTLLVNNIKSYTGDTVTISGSNVSVQGKTTLGDGSGTDTVKVRANLNVTGSMFMSGSNAIIDVSGSVRADSVTIKGTGALLVNSSHAVVSNVTSADVTFGNNIINTSFHGSTFHFGSDSAGGTHTPITTHQNFTTTRYVSANSITASGNITASGDIYGADRYLEASSSLIWDFGTNPHRNQTSIAHEAAHTLGFYSGSTSTINLDLASGHISASGHIVANLPSSEAAAESSGLFTLSGSQIFSSSAWTSGHFLSGATSASLFVFQKA